MKRTLSRWQWKWKRKLKASSTAWYGGSGKLKVESAPFCILPWQLMRGKYVPTAQGIDFQQINFSSWMLTDNLISYQAVTVWFRDFFSHFEDIFNALINETTLTLPLSHISYPSWSWSPWWWSSSSSSSSPCSTVWFSPNVAARGRKWAGKHELWESTTTLVLTHSWFFKCFIPPLQNMFPPAFDSLNPLQMSYNWKHLIKNDR